MTMRNYNGSGDEKPDGAQGEHAGQPDQPTRDNPERGQAIRRGECNRAQNQIDPRNVAQFPDDGRRQQQEDAIKDPAHPADEGARLNRRDRGRENIRRRKRVCRRTRENDLVAERTQLRIFPGVALLRSNKKIA